MSNTQYWQVFFPPGEFLNPIDPAASKFEMPVFCFKENKNVHEASLQKAYEAGEIIGYMRTDDPIKAQKKARKLIAFDFKKRFWHMAREKFYEQQKEERAKRKPQHPPAQQAPKKAIAGAARA